MKVSVVIPTYNDPQERLKRSIESVIHQSFTEWELIVVDDGSTEPFAGLNEKINDARITWLSLGENRGVANARNMGASVANGEYLAFLDTGDWWLKEKLAHQILLFSNNSRDVVFVYCGAKIHNTQSDSVIYKIPKKKYSPRELLVTNTIPGSCSSVVVKRKYFEEVGGFFSEYDIPEDKDLWYRLSKLGTSNYTDKVLVVIEIVENSRGANPELKRQTYLRYINKMRNDIDSLNVYKDVMSNYHTTIAIRYFMNNEPKKAFHDAIEACRYKVNKTIVKHCLVGIIGYSLGMEYRRLLNGLSKLLKIKHSLKKKLDVLDAK